jgi:twitching motility protein PilT
VNGIVTQMMGKSKIEDLKKEKNVDFSFTAKGVGTFRVNVFYQRHGLSLVCRVLPESPPTLEELALPPVMHSTIGYPNGLVLVTGPTGSGKSTTLAAMINGINRTKKGHILTLEDPIEFVHESDQCMVNQRSLGDHFTSFASALRAGLREDPDVILVGEMRDLETVKLALEAAETGHLVFGTLHTNSAAKSIDRIINVFPSEDQNQIRISLSESVRMIISQKLIRSKDGSKRLCFHDILINNHAVANLIREQKTVQILSAMQTGRAQGMQLMDHVLADAVAQGLVDGRTAWEAANDKTKFKQYEPKELTNLNKRPKVAA